MVDRDKEFEAILVRFAGHSDHLQKVAHLHLRTKIKFCSGLIPFGNLPALSKDEARILLGRMEAVMTANGVEFGRPRLSWTAIEIEKGS